MRIMFLLLLSASLLAGQPEPRPKRVRVPAWVEADAGEASEALGAEAVTASLDGEPAAVDRVLGPRDGLMLLLASDMVGDMTLVDTAKRALAEQIGELPPNVWVGLLRAQDGLKVLVDPTPERGPVTAAIQALPVSGRAGLLESIQPAASLGDAILAKAAVRVAVLFVTDSDVRDYREGFANPVINESDYRDMSRRFPDALIRERISKLETALMLRQTPIFVVHLVYRGEALNEAYQAGLMRLASATGGTSIFCHSQTEIPDAIARALDRIASHYSIEVSLPEDTPEAVDISLESPGRSLNYRGRFSN